MIQATKDTQFTVRGIPVENVHHYKYLGKEVTTDNDDWLAICGNIKKARYKWARIKNILKNSYEKGCIRLRA